MAPHSPYRDTGHEERPMAQQRTSSWATEDSTREDFDPLLHKSDDSITFDFDDSEDASFRSRRRRKPWVIFGALCAFTFLVILLTLDIFLRISRATWPDRYDAEEEAFCEWGSPGSPTEGLSWYPTNFLQDVIPKPIHSHNDYWRKVPLFTALKQGCISVEADVWFFDDPNRRDILYVGHERAALQPNRTFQSLYIQPLVDILERQNPTTEFYDDTYRGIFDTAPNQTLTLLVDVKTAGPKTWAKVVEQLEPLRSRGWLTHYSDGTIHTRPITVVGTGNTPFDELISNTTYRDYFFDAPLSRLSKSNQYDETNSYYASVSFGSTIGSLWFGSLSQDQINEIRRQVKEAHAKGLKARYWDLPQWPVDLRNRVWDVLVREGVDLLNVDDVKGAAKRKWKY